MFQIKYSSVCFSIAGSFSDGLRKLFMFEEFC